MKIIYLSSVRIPSDKAASLAIVRQCEAFANLGHDVRLYIPKKGNEQPGTIESMFGIVPNFSITNYSAPARYDLGKLVFIWMMLRDSFNLYRKLRSSIEKTDVIYSRDHRLLFFLVLFGHKNKCFLELHTKHSDVLTKFISKRVNKLVVISAGLQNYYRTMTGRFDIDLEPSGVYLKQFEGLPSCVDLKNKFDLPTDKTILGYVGKYQTMGEGKGVDDIINAFSEAIKVKPNLFLFLVGIVKREENSLISKLENCGLNKYQFKVIELDQKIFAEYLKACDILLMNYPDTEHYQYFMSPTKLFAYMAVGKPIISSDLPSIRGILDNNSIRYTKPNSNKSFCEGIIYVVDNYKYMSKVAIDNQINVNNYEWKCRGQRIINYDQ